MDTGKKSESHGILSIAWWPAGHMAEVSFLLSWSPGCDCEKDMIAGPWNLELRTRA